MPALQYGTDLTWGRELKQIACKEAIFLEKILRPEFGQPTP